jgi:hypothetical protein
MRDTLSTDVNVVGGPLPPALRARLHEAELQARPKIVMAYCGGVALVIGAAALVIVAWRAPAFLAVSLAGPGVLVVRRALLGRLADAVRLTGTPAGAATPAAGSHEDGRDEPNERRALSVRRRDAGRQSPGP